MQVRGVKVEALLCDKALSACQECQILWYPTVSKFINKGPQYDLCKNCFWPANRLFKSQNLLTHKYSQYITEEDKTKVDEISKNTEFEKIKNFKVDEISVGEHAYAGALRFYAIGVLKKNNFSKIVLKSILNPPYLLFLQ